MNLNRTQVGSRRARSAQPVGRRTRLALERLEQRDAMSATIVNDVLVIEGTNAAEIIAIEENPDDSDEVIVSIQAINPNTLQLIGDLEQEDFDKEDFSSILVDGFADVDIIGNLTNIPSTLRGGTGDDFLVGGGGNDILIGGLDDDSFFFNPNPAPFAGDAVAFATLGQDQVTEGDVSGAGVPGDDRLVFDNFPVGITLDLAITFTPQTVADILTLTLAGNLENVTGTEHDDVIRGNSRNNAIDPGAGDDTVEGRRGDDRITGTDGSDTFVFANPGGVDLGTDTIFESSFSDDAFRDTLDFTGMDRGIGVRLDLGTTQLVAFGALSLDLEVDGIENVRGTAFLDLIIGNGQANELFGNGARDRIFGLGGRDVLDGGAGNDDLIGGTGADLLFGGRGRDFLDGSRDGVIDRLFGNDFANTQDNERDRLVLRLRRRAGFLVPALEEILVMRAPDIVPTEII
jgi:Ca2+-binding RTX toxin-like protein